MTYKKDHYDKLPGFVCENLNRLIDKYSEEDWFKDKWEEYRSHILEAKTIHEMKMPGAIFNSEINPALVHAGVKGMKWGVRKEVEDKNQNGRSLKRDMGLVVGGSLVGASAIGAAWYLKNRNNAKLAAIRQASIVAKRNQTRATRKASGYYETFKNANVTITKGSDFVKQFENVKLTKLVFK